MPDDICFSLLYVTGKGSAGLPQFPAEFFPESVVPGIAAIDDGLRSVVLRALRMIPVIASALYLILDLHVATADITGSPGAESVVPCLTAIVKRSKEYVDVACLLGKFKILCSTRCRRRHLGQMGLLFV